eukprot:6172856-Pleurochrysis_carterae.AAC.1
MRLGVCPAFALLCPPPLSVMHVECLLRTRVEEPLCLPDRAASMVTSLPLLELHNYRHCNLLARSTDG